jgi:DNA-binding NarL/FixJ family response regulator
LSDLSAISASSGSVDEPSNDGAGHIAVVLGRFDALVAHGLTQILREDRSVRIVGADLGGAALERAVVERAPRVAVLDEAIVGEWSVLERVRAARPTVGIVVLAHLPTVAYAMRLFAGGASCVAKEASADSILAAVRIAGDGRRVFVADDGHLVERRHPATVASLTPRETEVLEYLSRGRSHGEIAHALQLGIETIRTHSAHIRDKLGVHRNRDLIGVPIPSRLET